MTEPQEGTRYNFKHICNNFYVVRTQAGLRRAIKHYQKAGGDDKVEVVVGKMTYPSVVAISNGQNQGACCITVSAVHVNRMIAALTGE